MLLMVWRMFCSPVNFALWATIPDCRTKRSVFPITFVMSIIWVSAITYVLSWFLTICGKCKSKKHVRVNVLHIQLLYIYIYIYMCIMYTSVVRCTRTCIVTIIIFEIICDCKYYNIKYSKISL